MEIITNMSKYSCTLTEFKINGKEADVDDFGYTEDLSPETAPIYGCGNRCFVPIVSTNKVLYKYDISINEYLQVCDRLCEVLHIGECCLCR